MRFDDAGDDGETEPAAARPASIGPPEAAKDVLPRRFRYAGPAIQYIDRARALDMDLDDRALGGMSDAVLNQVAQCLKQRLRIAFDPELALFARHLDLLVL